MLNASEDCPGVPKSRLVYCGFAAAVLLLDRFTKIDAAPTGAESVTVPTAVVPPVTTVGLSEKDAN